MICIKKTYGDGLTGRKPKAYLQEKILSLYFRCSFLQIPLLLNVKKLDKGQKDIMRNSYDSVSRR